MEVASCHPSGTYNFDVAPKLLENYVKAEYCRVYQILKTSCPEAYP
jgi:hypothetical protein